MVGHGTSGHFELKFASFRGFAGFQRHLQCVELSSGGVVHREPEATNVSVLWMLLNPVDGWLGLVLAVIVN